MVWNVKKVEENEKSIFVGYSKDSSCDGRIEYAKDKEEFKILHLAKDCDEFESKRLFQFLYALIGQGTLSFQEYSVRTG